MPPRFFASELRPPQAWLRGAAAEHLGRVLRARTGEIVELASAGLTYRACITSIRPEEIEFELLDSRPAAAPHCRIELAPAIFRFHRWEWLLEKAVELGVEAVQPVIAARSEPHLARAATARRERWQRLAEAAAGQSHRVFPPPVQPPLPLSEYLQRAGGEADARLWLREPAGDGKTAEHAMPLREWLRERGNRREENPWELPRVRLLSGPEGGWKDEECATLTAGGWQAVSLGPTVLRAETAPLAALAALVLML